MQPPLFPGRYYHVYNRGNNGDNIFLEKRNYHYFLGLYIQYVEPVTETYAYCLLRNHFHLLVRIKDFDLLMDLKKNVAPAGQEASSSEEDASSLAKYVSKKFGLFMGTYSKAINRAYPHSGSLFEKRFKRKHVDNAAYFNNLVCYIHLNPQLHGFVTDFRDWPFSSYGATLSTKPTRVQRHILLEWFGGQQPFQEAHGQPVNENNIAHLLMD